MYVWLLSGSGDGSRAHARSSCVHPSINLHHYVHTCGWAAVFLSLWLDISLSVCLSMYIAWHQTATDYTHTYIHTYIHMAGVGAHTPVLSALACVLSHLVSSLTPVTSRLLPSLCFARWLAGIFSPSYPTSSSLA
ncbi:uncharacterized protein J3D65DRAFT_122802 [Phyllosticta citribraziliensis]|uniref:Uncharacterized protein n=1 Tax=Phyllosticta citribraziliensis TaxID=989973 RepID=A0ABR1L8Y5_9PEZI